jgi:hypothetical protein
VSIRSRPFRNVVLGIACALLLLAQYAGIAHAVWHAYQQLPTQHEQNASGEDRPYAPELTRLCAFDAAFGQVLGCAPPPQNLLSSSAAANVYAAPSPHTRAALEARSPRSRGPPALS